MILVVIVLIVVGGLWWTKTLAFTATAFVQSSIAPVQTPNGSTSQYFISDVTPPDEVPVFSERLAQNLGGNASDYESDLTITASDTHGLAVTAKGRTPNAAKTLATDAAEVVRTILDEIKASDLITYTVVPPGGP